MQKKFIQAAALLGALSVILGAFGAHALKEMISEKSLAIFETGVRYQFYHAVALMLTGMLYKEFTNKYLLWAGRLYGIGMLLFCGSLYFLAIVDLAAHPGLKAIGAVTPFGGLCFIAGWLLLAVGAAKTLKQ
ncbi:DUF423 domain-containing protein [Ferruginibacter paludis]|uniref:DUF423 domain-containing protein n=1 Tax=Ferruginibacter paludis TaxID=1310417 RepID=UPI0025B471B5|nr:DUF423 domain-containing protein [Ferruginibacter paludis]MDN3658815.1 DUF423 domain-containing protein [Ferruginibacter paludis]